MNAVETEVRALVDKELAAANERFPQFHSQHEGYAVILEEICEHEAEFNLVMKYLKDAWVQIMSDNTPELSIKATGEHAMAAACEAIQVAAMCKKFLDMHGTAD